MKPSSFFLNRAIAIRDRVGVAPGDRYLCYELAAKIGWKAGRRREAIGDLRHALELAEQQRSQASGAEHEQADVFGKYTAGYHRMIAWQVELGDQDQAFSTIERARARSLVEQMERRGIDLLVGVPADQAETLRQREAKAQSRVAQLETQLGLLEQRRELSSEERKHRAQSLEERLAQARQDCVLAYGDIRNSSPAYRLSVAKDRRPVSLAALCDWTAARHALVLEYVVGEEKSFVLIVPPAGGQARIEPLVVKAEQAATLGIEAGPLTSARLQTILSNPKRKGVLARISTPDSNHPRWNNLPF